MVVVSVKQASCVLGTDKAQSPTCNVLNVDAMSNPVFHSAVTIVIFQIHNGLSSDFFFF